MTLFELMPSCVNTYWTHRGGRPAAVASRYSRIIGHRFGNYGVSMLGLELQVEYIGQKQLGWVVYTKADPHLRDLADTYLKRIDSVVLRHLLREY